jgi:DNA-binding Lrp family transcriptional regulator
VASCGELHPQQLNIGIPNMVTSIILINVKRNKVYEVAEQLADIPGISEVYSVTGKYDLVAIVRVKTNDELAELVTSKLVRVDGVTKTDTMLAFKAYSKHDLDAMFSM